MHCIDYYILGAGTGDTEYAATCRACGWSHVSASSASVAAAGPKHALDAFDREVAA
jgi:hypothetical protein